MSSGLSDGFAIGAHALRGRVLLAPMAGITDRPFRRLCLEFGAALTCGEMLHSEARLWDTPKSVRRRDHRGEPGVRAVQLAGAEPQQLAAAAHRHVQEGAEIIDINMGCPAKKVCDRLCGSALLGDEALVERIFAAVRAAVDVPVTVKIRTGPTPENRNAVRIARLAEAAGLDAISVHGRTRTDLFRGEAEFATVRAVKQTVNIPVIANGDIGNAARALQILGSTGADGVMIGRAAQGAPWIFRAVNYFLQHGKNPPPLLRTEIVRLILRHLELVYEFYGECTGLRMGKKHLSWYCRQLSVPEAKRLALLAATDTAQQYAEAAGTFEAQRATHHDPLPWQRPAAAQPH